MEKLSADTIEAIYPAPTEAQILAAVNAAELSPATLILPTFGVSQVPAANEIGLNQDGLVAIGDGATVQGVPAISTRRVSGSSTIDVVGMPKAGAAKRVVAIPIYANELVEGAIISIVGTTEYFKKDIQSISGLDAGIAVDGGSEEVYNGTVGWSNAILHPNPGANTAITFDRSSLFGSMLLVPGNPGNVGLDPSEFRIAGIQAIYADGTDAVTTNPGTPPNYNFTEETPEEVATDFWLMYQVAATGGGNFGAASTFYVNYDLTVSVTLP